MNFYLKYRPQKISELDLTSVRDTLEEILKTKSVPHAWLLAGPKGTGKTSSARIIAKSVNCLKRSQGSAEPCNHCDACRAITSGTAMDILEIDAASNRGIDDIRELKDKINLAPSQFKYKVYIIDEVHMLTKEAFNALLKTLEEPPAHALFILATTEAEKLPETVVSRCLVVKFTKAAPAELKRSLKRVAKGEKLKVGDEKLTEIASAADGSFRDAVKLLEHPTKLKPFQLDDWLVLVYRRQTKPALEWLQEAWKEGTQARQLILAAIERLRQVLLGRLGVDGGEDIAALGDAATLRSLLQRLITAAGEIKESAIEALPLELAVVEWGQSGEPTEAVKPGPAPAAAKAKAGKEEILSGWPRVLEAVKPVNHSLEALLRATEPAGFQDGFLMIKVFYQFHKDRLEEDRYRSLVEQIASKVLVAPIKIKFFLTAKLTPTGDQDIIKTAEEVFGIEVSD